MIIDCHYHLDNSMLPLADLLASMDRHGIDRVALIPRLNPPLSINPLLEKIALPVFRRGLHRPRGWLHRAMTAIYQNNVKPDGRVDILGNKFEIFPKPPNEEVLQAVRAYPDRFYGWVFVNPAGPEDSLAVIQNCMAVPGLIGVKAHPYWHNYPVRKLEPVAAWCEQHGKPMLIHLGVGENGDYRFLPDRFPRLKIIYAHTGVPASASVCSLARQNPNLFVDLSSSSYVDLRAARAALQTAGPHHCLFGTDGPYFHVHDRDFDFAYFRLQLDHLPLSPPDRERILGRNFLDLQ